MTVNQKFRGRILSIAGSDSGGGAGIQADIKTISAMGGYAMTAVTALTAQDTLGIKGLSEVDPDFVVLQARAAIEDIGVDAIKIGMLPSREHIAVLSGYLRSLNQGIPVVLDPVMRASTGEALGSEADTDFLKEQFFPILSVLTPNSVEASQLSGLDITSMEDMAEAGRALCAQGLHGVLVTGGHLEGRDICDVLVSGNDVKVFVNPRLESRNTHGTGCTLSSALATGLGFGKPLEQAAEEAITYVHQAIKHAEDLGAGSGPLNHQFGVRRKHEDP